MPYLYLLPDIENPSTGAHRRYARLVNKFKRSNRFTQCNILWPLNYCLKLEIQKLHQCPSEHIFLSFSIKKLALLLPLIFICRGPKIAIVFIRKNIINYSAFSSPSLKERILEKIALIIIRLLRVKLYFHLQSTDDAFALIDTYKHSVSCLITPNNFPTRPYLSQELDRHVKSENYELVFVGSEVDERKNFAVFKKFLYHISLITFRKEIKMITIVGTYRPSTISSIASILRSNNIKFKHIERYQRITEIYSPSSILIFASLADSFPNLLLEWISLNGLFIASNLYITRMIIDSSHHKILFDPVCSNSLTLSLQTLITNPQSNYLSNFLLSNFGKSLHFVWEDQILQSITTASYLNA